MIMYMNNNKINYKSLNFHRNISNYSVTISYSNVEELKNKIFKDNNKKTDIYMWTNKISGENNVGSAVDISRRLNNYFSSVFLKRELKKGNSIIYKALLKYGYSNFNLDILEYCLSDELIKREQYYIDKLKPSYNILKIAGSFLGLKHSEVTKQILSKKSIGRRHSKETLIKISYNNFKSKSVEIKDIKTGLDTEFSIITKASEFMGIIPYHFQYYLDKQPIKGRYLIVKFNGINYTVNNTHKKILNFKV